HFTPGVSISVGLREVLRMSETEGLANVFKRHDRLARAARAGVEALGLELFAKATPSPALTAVAAPKGVDSETIVAAYSKAHNITIADRKSTRLNSSHQIISYAVFCLKKKKKQNPTQRASRNAYQQHPPLHGMPA